VRAIATNHYVMVVNRSSLAVTKFICAEIANTIVWTAICVPVTTIVHDGINRSVSDINKNEL
jgi:hypothetical protein